MSLVMLNEDQLVLNLIQESIVFTCRYLWTGLKSKTNRDFIRHLEDHG
jgi:hypothetical protein